jgi:hypothetical protein
MCGNRRNGKGCEFKHLWVSIAPGRRFIAPFFWIWSSRGVLLHRVPSSAASNAQHSHPSVIAQLPQQRLHLLTGKIWKDVLHIGKARSFRLGFPDVPHQ